MTWSGAVEEERVRQLGEQPLVGVAHLGVAGKQTEGTTFGDLEDAANTFCCFFGKIGLSWVRHVGRQVEESLFFVVEVRGDDELACRAEAKAATDVVEAAG